MYDERIVPESRYESTDFGKDVPVYLYNISHISGALEEQLVVSDNVSLFIFMLEVSINNIHKHIGSNCSGT